MDKEIGVALEGFGMKANWREEGSEPKIPSFLVSLALACGRTVGPGLEGSPGGGGCEGALLVRGVAVVGGVREGYLRAAPLAVRAAFDEDEPIFAGVNWRVFLELLYSWGAIEL